MASQIPEKIKWTQRVKDEWAKIRSFGWKDGIAYVWDYYKWYFIVIVVAILTVLAVNSGRDLRELVLHCSFSAEAYWDDPTYLDDFPSWAGLDEDKYYTYFDPITRYGTHAQFQISNWINTEQLDVIISIADDHVQLFGVDPVGRDHLRWRYERKGHASGLLLRPNRYFASRPCRGAGRQILFL